MRLAALFVLAGIVALSPGRSAAIFQTPALDKAFVFSPLEWDTGYSFALPDAENALNSQGYTVTTEEQGFVPGGGFTSQYIISDLAEAYGALAIYTHGGTGTGEPGIEYFEHQADADNQVAYLVSHGYVSSSEVTTFVVANSYGNVYYYAVVLTQAGLRRLSKPRSAVLHVAACYGGYSYSDWTTNGTASMASYGATCPTPTRSKQDAGIFWRSMNGFYGGVVRNLGNATYSTDLSLSSGANSGLVLAPWITNMQPPTGLQIKSPSFGYVTFDTEMQNSFPAVKATDALGFWESPHWTSSARVDYWIYPKALGVGTLTAYGSSLFSQGGIQVCTNGVKGNVEIHKYDCRPATPAIGVREIGAITDPLGAKIKFSSLWEAESDSFAVERIDDPANPTYLPTQVVASGGGAGGTYEITDPLGHDGSRYRLVERQSGELPDLRYGTFEATPPTSVVASEPVTYDQDSIATEVDALGNPGTTIETGGIPNLYVLIAPDSLCSDLGAYKSIMENQLGVSTSIVPISETSIHGGIRGYLGYAHHFNTQYALLVGDANDIYWWDDPSRWVNGWNWPRIGGSGPHIPSQPEHNLIPTYYTADTDSPRVAMSFYTPYYASDLPYADVDGDSLPDIRLGRLPVSSRADLLAYTAKLAAYIGTGLPSGVRTALLTYAQNNGQILGSDVALDADSVATGLPASGGLSRYTDTETTLWTYAHRESLANSAANVAPDYMVWLASGAQRDIYANYWRLDQGWSMARLNRVVSPNRFFVSLAFSCGMGNFDQTEQYASCDSQGTCTDPIRPIAERLLFDPEKGAIATIGPSRGTFEDGNRIFALELARQLKQYGRDLGTAFMIAQRSCIVQYPKYKHLFRSYNLLGDPILGQPTITGVSSVSGAPRVGLGRARPNPFNPRTEMIVSVDARSRVNLRVYDTRGRLVRTLMRHEELPPGPRRVSWDGLNDTGSRVASGVYFVRMETSGRFFRQKVVLLK